MARPNKAESDREVKVETKLAAVRERNRSMDHMVGIPPGVETAICSGCGCDVPVEYLHLTSFSSRCEELYCDECTYLVGESYRQQAEAEGVVYNGLPPCPGCGSYRCSCFGFSL